MNHQHHTQHHAKHGEHGHNHHQMMITDFKRRFIVCCSLTIPVLLLSPMIQNWIGVDWSFEYGNFLLFVLSSIIYIYGGWPFFKGIVKELKAISPGMMTLITVAISSAYLYSAAVTFGVAGKTFYWELATLIDVMLIGHWLEMRSILGASKALESLAALMPQEAHLITNDGVITTPIKDLNQGDLILVKPGEKIPADGIVEEGKSEVNESMLTGESKPVTKYEDQSVIGGSINGMGTLKIRINGLGENTFLSRVILLVQDAQKQKSKTQRLADVAAKWLTIIALVVGSGTFIIWLVLGKDLSFALERMVTVMVICCPHALGLAVPLVASISTSISAKNGLLIRNRAAFENSRKITTIVFDKTGTLTVGSHEVSQIVSLHKAYSEDRILQLASAVEAPSEHHIAKGLLRKSSENFIDVPSVKSFKYEAGIGVSGVVEGLQVSVGGFLKLTEMGLTAPDVTEKETQTKVFLTVDKELVGFITFEDQIRDSSFGAIASLKKQGITCHLLTGDNNAVAKDVSLKLGLDKYQSGVLPDQKLQVIKNLQDQGEFVAMTGDGINDAPALAQADIGIAIGSGTDVAAETADIILVDSDPKDISNLIIFGKATYNKMVQNLIWATGYNVIALPMATGFIPGVVISPAFGAALMALSTVICATNAQFLKSKKL